MEKVNIRFSEMFTLVILMATVAVFFSGCDKDDNDSHVLEIEYDFKEDDGGWEPFFAGFNVGWEENMELQSGYRKLPEPLNTSEYGHFISANNRSDDVRMVFRKQVEGLQPNKSYMVGYTIKFGTEVPSGCVGIGGPPGEAVKVIANASQIKPEAIVVDDYYYINVEYLSDNPGEWYQNAIIGDIANSRQCEEGYGYEIKEVTSGPLHDVVTADENGRAWLLFGTRSGFEGRTDLYYTYFRAVFTR
jgi:hypothetical protein